MKEIFERRSIRKYKGKEISQDYIQKILRAAMYAPSAGNEQPWHFVVIKDRQKLDEIASFHPHGQMLKEAPLAIIPCADQSNLKYEGLFWIQDMSACIQNILLQSKALGLGTCWCGVYPREELMEGMAKLVHLPAHITPVAVIAVGYPAEEREVRERYNPDRVHNESW